MTLVSWIIITLWLIGAVCAFFFLKKEGVGEGKASNIIPMCVASWFIFLFYGVFWLINKFKK